MVLRVSLLGELSITGDLDPGTGALQARAEIERQPAGPGRDARELAVLEALAAPLNARHGHSSAELQLTLKRSVALAESLRGISQGGRGSVLAHGGPVWPGE